jgi:uncharacterized membrane protein YccC
MVEPNRLRHAGRYAPSGIRTRVTGESACQAGWHETRNRSTQAATTKARRTAGSRRQAKDPALSDSAIYLRWRADEHRALAEEHCEGPADPHRLVYFTVELTLRELAEALEALENDHAKAA